MQAELPIDFAVIGGSLAGLASAIALRRVGHRVTVFEESDLADPVSPCSPPGRDASTHPLLLECSWRMSFTSEYDENFVPLGLGR